MNKALRITGVKVITKIERPVVVFETTGGAVVRALKLAFIDLQNSARALRLPSDCLDRGFTAMHPAQREVFIMALHECVGATLSADITDYKAGDAYAVRAGHPALTDPKHKDYGKVKKEGDTLVAEKDGRYIDGFLSIPLTREEQMINKSADAFGMSMMAMFGFNAPSAPTAISAQTVVDVEHEDVPLTAEELANIEAFGGGQTEPDPKDAKK